VVSGAVLRAARERAGLSQRELAARAGIRQPAISEIESDKVAPSVERLAQLVSLCGYRLSVGVAERPARVDRGLLADSLRALPEERLENAIRISRYALALRGEGRRVERELIERELRELDELSANG
jgi:transcriptional regulator with XRE-family HTH domain